VLGLVILRCAQNDKGKRGRAHELRISPGIGMCFLRPLHLFVE
jgi:hypothetical protein